MAAPFTITASALSAPNALSSRGGASGLSSGNAFQTTSIVQQGPVVRRAHRIVTARASLGAKESKAAARREVLASILAAGAALGFGGRAVADPIKDAKTRAGEIFKTKPVESAKQAIDEKGPKLPDAGPQVEEAKKKVAGSIDNIFGKGKAPSLKLKPTSGPGSTKFEQSFGNLGLDIQNGKVSVPDPQSAAESAKSGVGLNDNNGNIIPFPDANNQSAKSNLQSKGGELVQQAKDSASNLPKAPSLPDFSFPKPPELPKVDLPKLGK